MIDAITDPDTPTLPPHVTLSQAKSYSEALIKGDPEAGGILWQTFKLGVSVASLLGKARDWVPLYGCGGFITYDEARLCGQLGGWAEEGFSFVKMKVG